MAEDNGKKEDQFGFTPEGEALGYISLEQARVVAMRTAREAPGAYGRRFSGVPMVFDLVEQQEGEDYYIITLSLRPEGDFEGRPGQEQFFIEKEGAVAHRNLLSLPKPAKGGFPLVKVAIGLAVVAVIGVVAAVIALSAGDDEKAPGTVAAPTAVPATTAGEPVPTDTPIPTLGPTSTPAVVDTQVQPAGFRLNVGGIAVGPGEAVIIVPNGIVFLSTSPNDAGLYPGDTEITLEASPELSGSIIIWEGVDFYSGREASITMGADRSVSVEFLTPPTPAPEARNDLHGDTFDTATSTQST